MKVNFNSITSSIKPMHAVGQPPFMGSNFEPIRYLQEAGIPYSRLHDVGGMFGGGRFVDIHNVFPHFDADENDPASYDFFYTDLLVEALMRFNCPPIFRLGETIENDQSRGFPARYINPPKDYGKWARICEHIVRHYNEGWANGFEYNIEYWEIWNEPDNGYRGDEGPMEERNMMWTGSFEQFYELYAVTAKHLRACFGDSIKIGGFGSSGVYAIFNQPEKYGAPTELAKTYSNRFVRMLTFLNDFLDYVKEQGAPLDFFSWHSYADVERTAAMAEYVDRVLKEKGFGNAEQHLNEWNNAHSKEGRGTSYAAAHAAAMMIRLHSTATYMMCYYDARIGPSVYGGMFNPIIHTPFCLYYAFAAFGKLFELKEQAECICEEEGIYALAATDGKTERVLVANIGDGQKVTTNLEGFEVYLIDENHSLEKVDMDSQKLDLEANAVVLLEKSI